MCVVLCGRARDGGAAGARHEGSMNAEQGQEKTEEHPEWSRGLSLCAVVVLALVALGSAPAIAQGNDVSISAGASPTSCMTGDTVTLTLTASGYSATGVTVTGVLPAGLTFLSATPPAGGSCSSNCAGATTVTCSLPTLSGSAVFTIGATASAAGTLKTVAGVVANEYDPTPSNNTSFATITVTQAPAPTISSLNPTIGYTPGGTPVTVYGSNFRSGATVSFGGTAATGVTFVNPGQLTAITPAHAAGAVNVVVTNPDGQTWTLTNGFTYQAPPVPTITAVNPNTGPTTGNTPVTITGTNFVLGATVTFGGTAATGISVVNGTTINAITPARGAYGPVNVVVTTSGGSATLPSGYTYRLPTPTITSLSPSTGPPAGGTVVTISGTNFALSGTTVKFGSTPATNVVVGGAGTTITATTPASSIGRVNVVVTVPDGQTATLPNGFTYLGPAPTVTGISPNFGPPAGGQAVTISGTNFRAGATVQIGSGTASAVSVPNGSTITALTPPGPLGMANVTVTNQEDGQSATLAGGYTYVGPPIVNSLDKTAGPLAGGQIVTISGSGFRPGATVRFGSNPASAVTVVTSYTISATTPPGAAGTVSVSVINADLQTGTLPNAYAYRPAPVVSLITPSTGWANYATSVTVSGANFVSGATVTFGSAPASAVFVQSANSISATTPALGPGTVSVTVTNPEGQSGVLSNAFTYVLPPPTISAVSPAIGSAAGGTRVAISGVDFRNGATVTVGGVPATNVVWGGAGQLGATTGPHGPGIVDVVVTNPDASMGTKSGGFTYVNVVPLSPREDTGGNGILEPGETVSFVPTWKNLSGASLTLTGSASGFTGPPGATYSLTDATASYGTVPNGASADCQTATNNCYTIGVGTPASRPATHWDATFLETLSSGQSKGWTVHIGQTFSDVPVSDGGYSFVETLVHEGITAGCGGSLYCPGNNVTRWQMAVFLARTMVGPTGTIPVIGTVSGAGTYNCSAGGNSLFSDVPPTDIGCSFVHYIYAQGLTGGCGGGNYCPADNVTRWQMAVFLARGMLGPAVPIPTSGTVPGVGSYNCTSGGVSLFGDVAPSDVACPHIHYIYSQAVTTGCGGGNYCPADNVTRWQMAVFLVRAFRLSLLY